ncbi:MucBP domain-containing protein [Listeria welshimeri]|uniref:MucBP domain-containing protein n=1 Tax=Listeria welshimeri TaxID=1643 RepID=UPI001888DE1A|nr:MucBP domain-containing protein [Listeria welshimeri]
MLESFTYEISSAVEVEYQDEEGNTIHDSQYINGNVGDAYDASVLKYQLEIPGYLLDQTKVFYSQDCTATNEQIIELVEEYIYYYNNERIQLKLNKLPPGFIPRAILYSLSVFCLDSHLWGSN